MAKLKSIFLQQIESFIQKQYGEQKSKKIIATAWARYEELCAENADEAQFMYPHTRDRIYPGIASFDAMLAHGATRDEAANLIFEYYSWRSAKMGKKIRSIMKFPGLYKKAPTIFKKMLGKMFSTEAGFATKDYATPKTAVRFDMIQCPYVQICAKYGCAEIVKSYCHADILSFGNMHKNVVFHRTQTLGEGGTCCDFSIKITKENQL
ncbi:MAG: L-2-amino-thiazoline-4-carboxylic acid hydrolase [Spirochaetales bacterium]